jgi:hypothetical protein
MTFPVFRLVTAEEVVAFVAPMNGQINLLEETIINAVEEMVESFCNRRFELQGYDREQYFIRRPSVQFDGITVAPRLELRLKNRPVQYFTKLEQVTSRDVSNVPIDPAEISRDFYSIDFDTGLLLFSFSAIGPDPMIWPFVPIYPRVAAGPYIELLCSYSAGFDPIPSQLKLAVLQIIYRIYMLTIGQNWHRTETQTAGAVTIWERFIRLNGLTPEEQFILTMYRVPSAA